MKRLLACALLIFGFAAPEAKAQALPTRSLASPKPEHRVAAREPAKAQPAKSRGEGKEEKDGNDAMKQALGENNLPKGQPIITEIFADEAFFDSAHHIGIFTGHVIVNDPRFNVQSDKLTVYLSKTEPTPPPAGDQPPDPATPVPVNQTLEKAVAEGNVGVVRERPDEKGGPPVRSVGRSDMAIYTTSDGNVELRGTPRVQSGMNTHIATSPDTVMVLQGDGQLVTTGPSRTEIRQQPKPSPSPTPAPAKP